MGCSVRVCLLLGLFTLVNGLGSFLPSDKEVIYQYNALIKAGAIVLNKPHDSAFFLSGQLHIQSPQDDFLIAQLKNVSFKLFNGETSFGYEEDLKEFPIPKESTDYMRPFKVMFNKAGQIEAIVTDKTEQVFARNMHKALAGMLHVKKDSIDFNSDLAHAFVTDESSIYGKSHVVYNVLPRKNKVFVKKMHDMRAMKTTGHLYHTVFTNTADLYCEARYEEPFSHESQQIYTFRKENGNVIPYKIEATGAAYLYPYFAKSNAHYIRSTTTLDLLSINLSTAPIKVDNELIENQLSFNPMDPKNEREIADVFSMNHKFDRKKVMSLLEESMEEMDKYLHLNSLGANTVDIRKSQVVSQMVKLLMPLKLSDLAKLYFDLSSKNTKSGIKNIQTFHQLLPLVGTHASIVLISKIVRDRKVEDSVALHMLQTLSGYVEFPTEELLKDTEHMLTWGSEIDSNVRRAALLNFAMLIKKTYTYQKALFMRSGQEAHEKQQYRNIYISEDVQRFLNKHSIYDRYVNDFSTKIQDTELSTQVLYAEVLYNTGVPSSIIPLLPIVAGKVSVASDARVVAMYVVYSHIAGDHDQMVEIFWPIFTDWTEASDIRIMAYYFIMITQPPMSRLLNIFWEMQNEPNNELYNFHYTFLQEISSTTDPCRQVFKVKVIQLLRMTQKPVDHGRSRYLQINYLNEKYNFGKEMGLVWVTTDEVTMFTFDLYSNIANIKMNDYSFFVRVVGLSNELAKIAELSSKEPEELFNFERWMESVKNISTAKGVRIHISISRNYDVVQSYYFTEKNMNDMYRAFTHFMREHFSGNQNTLNIYYNAMIRLMVPTEIGIPAYLEIMSPTMIHKRVNASTQTKNSVTMYHVDNMYHVSQNERWGMSYFNPILNTNQGVAKKSSIDIVLPIRGDFSFSPQSPNLIISLKMHPNQEKNTMGLRSYVSNHVFAEPLLEESYLQRSCVKCTTWHTITNGKYARRNETLLYHKGTITGFATKAVIFNSESYDEATSILNYDLGNSNKGILRSLILYAQELYLGVTLPLPYTQGYLLTAYPTAELQITQIDLSLRLVTKINQKPNDFLPALKFAPRFTYDLLNKDKRIQTWDVSLNMEVNSGHTTQSTKLEITRVIPDKKDYKVCVDSMKEWIKEGVRSQTHIGMGETAGGICGNDSTVDILMTGEMTNEEKSPYHLYEVCDLYSHDLGADYYSIGCASTHTSIRKYDYDVKMQHIPSEYRNTLSYLMYTMFRLYKPYHRYHSTRNPTALEDDHFKTEIRYLTNDKEVNVKYIDKDVTHEFIGLPAEEISFITLQPDNTHYSKFYMILSNAGVANTCTVENNKIQTGFNKKTDTKSFDISVEWTFIMGDAATNATNGVYLKKVRSDSETMALKLVHNEHTVEIYDAAQKNEVFKILVDGIEVSHSDNYNEDWFNYAVRSSTHEVIITNLKFKMHMLFTAVKLTICRPLIPYIEYYGPCVYKNEST